MEKSPSYIDSLQAGAGPSEPAADGAAGRTALRKRPRRRGLLVAAGCLAALSPWCWLEPNPTGMGTHERIGLPACEFLARSGWPCPTCGMTTSLSAMAHGRFVAACKAHPFGVMLFAGVAVVALAGAAQAVTGRDCLRLLRPRLWWVAAAAVGLAAGWGLKILIGLADGTLPMR